MRGAIRSSPLSLRAEGLIKTPPLFGNPATSLVEAVGFASPPHDGFALLAAPLEEDALALINDRQKWSCQE